MVPESYPATGGMSSFVVALILLPLIWRVADADKNGCFLFYLACTPVLLGQRLLEVAMGKRFGFVWGFQCVRQIDVDAVLRLTPTGLLDGLIQPQMGDGIRSHQQLETIEIFRHLSGRAAGGTWAESGHGIVDALMQCLQQIGARASCRVENGDIPVGNSQLFSQTCLSRSLTSVTCAFTTSAGV